MSIEDKRQESIAIGLKQPELPKAFIKYDIIDIQKSRAWNSTMSYIPVKQTSIDIESIIDLMESLKSLTPRERQVIIRLLKEYTIGEIAKELGISYRRVLQLKANAIKRMGQYYGV